MNESREKDGVLKINLEKTKCDISEHLYGLFFEDINNGLDGGLYGELIKNGSFEFEDNMEAWNEIKLGVGEVKLTTENSLNDIKPNHISISCETGSVGIANGGFGGIVLKKDEEYRVSFYGKNYTNETVEITLLNENGQICFTEIVNLSNDWKKYEFVKVSKENSVNGVIKVMLSVKGKIDVDFISVFPVDTFCGRENGFRKDLAQTLADIKPSFFRFPGGCIVEGKSMDNAYLWKPTIGDLTERRGNQNLWGYHQSFGTGYHEYLQYCEDIGAEPVPILNVGMACQARKGVHAPMEDLDIYIQDALDLIEYCNGSTDTKWGAERAKNGHIKPFNLKFLGIGNEQWGADYFPRYEKFYDVVKAKYPDIKYIFASGPFADGFLYNEAWDWAKKTGKADIIDEHYYMAPDWFLQNINRYDNYDRKGPKVFAGEYAAHNSKRKNNLEVALAEAAYMTGLEKNSDVVVMVAYAPLLAKYNEFQWAPNLVWFNNETVVKTPSYYVQNLFSNHKGEKVVESTLDITENKEKRDSFIKGGVGVGSIDTTVEYKDFKVTGLGGKILFEDSLTKESDIWNKVSGDWSVSEKGLAQTNVDGKHLAIVENTEWTSYTVSVKAKKTGGLEGFLLIAGAKDKENYYVWNLAGWQNKFTAVQRVSALVGYEITTMDPVEVENDRWYDLSVKVEGKTITCYLDGKEVHKVYDEIDYKDLNQTVAVKGDEIIIKTVNTSSCDYSIEIDIETLGNVADKAEVITLKGEKLSENSLEEPNKVTPQCGILENVSKKFTYTFEKDSLVILKLKKI